MPGRGPAPQKEHTRKSNDKATTKLVSDGKLRGFVLPRGVLKHESGRAMAWHPMTVRWWNGWRKSPQALRMQTQVDWDYLLDTALLHHTMWTEGRMELQAEIRLRLQKFGATPEDRTRLGFEIASTAPEPPAPRAKAAPKGNVSSIDDRRKRLTTVAKEA